MRRLYWKIFFAFWLVMVLVIVTNMAVTWIQVRHFQDSQQQREHISELAEDAVEIFEQDGRQAITSWAEQLFHRTQLKVLLLDEHNRQVNGRPPPPYVTELLQRRNHSAAFPRQPKETEPSHRDRLRPTNNIWDAGRKRPLRPLIWPVTGESGKRYHFVVLNPFELTDHLYARSTILWRIGIAVLIVALVAMLLSHYLVKPIRILQHASRKLSDGDLNSRVALAMGTRKDELGQLGQDFDTMAQRIQALLEGQQQMLRDVSHELRTPLARLRVALELSRKRNGESGELDRIELEAERINELIDEILQLVRLNSGQSDFHPASVELSSLLEPLVADANFEQQRVTLIAAEPLQVWGDEKLLCRAVENIVRNALKYSDAAVTLVLEKEDRWAQIRIQDQGPGVDDDALAQLFEPFYRADQARQRQTGGYGLGLAIAARAIKLHRGSIKAQNRNGGGLEVTIRLPLQQTRH